MFFNKLKIIIYEFLNKSLLLALVFLLIFNFVEANDQKIVINEVAWMGTSEKSSDEWIELKNLSDKDIDLTGWSLESGEYEIELDEEKVEIEDKKNKIKLEGKIKADDFFLMEKTDGDSTDEKEDLIYSGSFSLSDSGEDLILRNEKGEKIDEIEVDDNWPAGDKEADRTMEKTEDGDWQDSFVVDGTPGEENSTEEAIKDEKTDEDEDENENVEEDLGKCVLENRAGLDKVYLNEILSDPLEEETEWIEIYNSSDEEIYLNGCFLVDKNLYDKKDLSKYFSFEKGEKIKNGGYKVLEKTNFGFGINNSDEEIYLLDENGDILSEIFWGNNFGKGFSYALGNSEWQWTETATPGFLNQFPIPKIYSKKIEITELMPNPEGKDEDQEWVELLSGEEEKIKLDDWYFLNQSNQRFKLDELVIELGQRLKVSIISTTSFLRNSNGRVDLVNPNGEIVDTVSYLESAKENVSLNKNLTGQWLWSIFITPGAENKFNSLPTYKVDIPDKIYEDVKAEFKIKKAEDEDGEVLKYRWDFGDGSKSYLQETTHTFSKKDQYTIQTRVRDLSSDVFKIFEIKVEKFPQLDLKIIKILPNPKGRDSKNEKIWIENREDETVNLKGWIVATGENMEKLTNHYIKDNFKIKVGKVKSLNRDDCSFFLLNKKGRVVLKSPNGKVVDKVKYEKEKIKEDELYYLENDFWNWSKPVLIKEETLVVLSEATSNLVQIDEAEKSFLTMNELFRNSRLGRTDGLKVIFFDNWLFTQSQNLFFKFIFPTAYWDRFGV